MARIGLLVLAGLLVPGSGIAAARAGTSVTVRVTSTAISAPVRSGFLGLALEFNDVPHLAGPTVRSVNPVFVALLHNLDPSGRAPLRIGGQSTARSWWPVPGMPRPLGITYNLSPRWAADARALAEATGTRLMPGIEFEADNPRISEVEARQLVSRIGRRHIAALEIGNEPELYRAIPWYKVLAGRPVPWYSPTGTPEFNRSPAYGPSTFVSEFRSIMNAMPPMPIAGPSSGAPSWLHAFEGLVSSSSRVKIVTSHAYSLLACVHNPSSPYYPSVPHLLRRAAGRHLAHGLTPLVRQAHRAGARFRVDEVGSVACNGRAGVSNTFSSALWLLDTLFAFAAKNVDGVNLHTYPGLPNNLFDFRPVHGRWTGQVHPLYYGALMFARAAPPGSRILKVEAGGQRHVRVWATRTGDGSERVLMLNDDPSSSRQAQVALAGAGSTGRVERLVAPSVYATSGVSLGGRSFGASTSTGVLAAPSQQTVKARNGQFTLALPAGSATLLTIAPRPRSTDVLVHDRFPVIVSAGVFLLLALRLRRPKGQSPS
ncbi:MAG TPA: glycosyl hydrolase family 79 C-terminal domain-containing protein [Solirubrobacteraceae bacterium]|nr:glycosyl hydrolase family 79 C-terminal domain-containing protein [Solirubrobacteraceae bacterium]